MGNVHLRTRQSQLLTKLKGQGVTSVGGNQSRRLGIVPKGKASINT